MFECTKTTTDILGTGFTFEQRKPITRNISNQQQKKPLMFYSRLSYGMLKGFI